MRRRLFSPRRNLRGLTGFCRRRPIDAGATGEATNAGARRRRRDPRVDGTRFDRDHREIVMTMTTHDEVRFRPGGGRRGDAGQAPRAMQLRGFDRPPASRSGRLRDAARTLGGQIDGRGGRGPRLRRRPGHRVPGCACDALHQPRRRSKPWLRRADGARRVAKAQAAVQAGQEPVAVIVPKPARVLAGWGRAGASRRTAGWKPQRRMAAIKVVT